MSNLTLHQRDVRALWLSKSGLSDAKVGRALGIGRDRAKQLRERAIATLWQLGRQDRIDFAAVSAEEFYSHLTSGP